MPNRALPHVFSTWGKSLFNNVLEVFLNTRIPYALY